MYAHVLAYYKSQLDLLYQLENITTKEFRRLTAEVNANNRHFGSEQKDKQLAKWFEINRELDSICTNKLKLLLKTEERVKRLQRLDYLRSFDKIPARDENP